MDNILEFARLAGIVGLTCLFIVSVFDSWMPKFGFLLSVVGITSCLICTILVIVSIVQNRQKER